MANDFIGTIDSDDEGNNYAESSTKGKQVAVEKDDFDPDFEFDFGGGGRDTGLNAWETEEVSEVQRVSEFLVE